MTLDAQLWSTDQVLAYLESAGRPVARKTWAGYVARGQAPRPLREHYVGRTPRWPAEAIKAWDRHRPGQGARTDLTDDPTGDTPEG